MLDPSRLGLAKGRDHNTNHDHDKASELIASRPLPIQECCRQHTDGGSWGRPAPHTDRIELVRGIKPEELGKHDDQQRVDRHHEPELTGEGIGEVMGAKDHVGDQKEDHAGGGIAHKNKRT